MADQSVRYRISFRVARRHGVYVEKFELNGESVAHITDQIQAIGETYDRDGDIVSWKLTGIVAEKRRTTKGD